MTKWSGLVANSIATLFFWLAAALAAQAAGESNDFVNAIAILAALGCTIALWMVWAFSALDQSRQLPEQSAEKAKRSVSQDDRVALLMGLMTETEREAVKQRLLDGFQTDGESIPLAELLAEQEQKQNRAS